LNVREFKYAIDYFPPVSSNYCTVQEKVIHIHSSLHFLSLVLLHHGTSNAHSLMSLCLGKLILLL